MYCSLMAYDNNWENKQEGFQSWSQFGISIKEITMVFLLPQTGLFEWKVWRRENLNIEITSFQNCTRQRWLWHCDSLGNIDYHFYIKMMVIFFVIICVTFIKEGTWGGRKELRNLHKYSCFPSSPGIGMPTSSKKKMIIWMREWCITRYKNPAHLEAKA